MNRWMNRNMKHGFYFTDKAQYSLVSNAIFSEKCLYKLNIGKNTGKK